MIPVTRTDISPETTGEWVDVDVSAYVDPDNTAGVMLEIVNLDTYTDYYVGIRKNGSEDDASIYYKVPSSYYRWTAIGIDENGIFECKINKLQIHIFIVAYIKNTEGSFFTNFIDKSPGVTGWSDINISGDTGDDTAVCAFVRLKNIQTTWYNYALRKNGSTDEHYQGVKGISGGMMSVDVNEIFEAYIANTNVDIFLDGYLVDNFGDWVNSIDYSTETTESWVDVDMSSDIPSGNDGAFMQFQSGGYRAGIRKKDTAIDNYGLIRNNYLWVEISPGRIAEQKIQATLVDLWLWGYTKQPAAPPKKKLTLVQFVNIQLLVREGGEGKDGEEDNYAKDKKKEGIKG